MNMIDDDVSLFNLGPYTEAGKILDAIMEVNMMLVYRFQCGPVPRADMAEIRKKVSNLSVKAKGEAKNLMKISSDYSSI
ncbi:hypothetical protein GM672_01720 [Massilia buxea]|uniref:Uncharacterized protein n=1 Tax=Pseudoduganella buxea TaxID=1949069 RepID=A0A6I3SST7_9BURK|nr:hypothetical protein [Pseudoduganella buxea]MTV51442.1 hypothetical protein [Pseudoduganella buxea]